VHDLSNERDAGAADVVEDAPVNGRCALEIDPIEHAIATDESSAILRHDVRNKLSAVKNALFYLRRRVEKTEVYATDARMGQFFTLVDDELGALTTLIEQGTRVRPLGDVEMISIADAIHRAGDVPSGVQLSVGAGGRVRATITELSYLFRLLYAEAEARGRAGEVLTVRAGDKTLLLELGASPSATGPADGLSPRLRLARRVAMRHGGTLAANDAGVVITLPAEEVER
jgi:hypothetical protein